VKRLFNTKFWRLVRHFAPAHLVAIVGIAASVAVWYLVFSAEQRAMIQEFNGRANNLATIMESGVNDYWDELYVTHHVGILNIAWAPRVKRDERVAHELAANRARMQERRALELDLRMAVANNEFTLNYQPIVNIKYGKVKACEALVRWHHAGRGWVPPVEFVPIAEETGLIAPIGEWVLRQACADAAEWPDEIAVSVNVSPAQLKSANFVQVVADALADSSFPAERLELEITELVLMHDNIAGLAALHKLKGLGVRIAIDDFGTGYSSLGYLRSFPFDRIKIDQSFIRDLSKDKESLAIVRAVVGLGRGLGIVTTAEGVETQHQLEVLRTEGCTDAQGFFFSQPQTANDVRFLLASLDGRAKAMA
jgi:EAL domain-containing protein (putative c-di-GMP-specific phosphodiesterase class I)